MIHIFSNFANDIIAYENNRIVPGWPALWISKALDASNIRYKLVTGGESAIVKIDKDIDGEDRGIILSTPMIPYVFEEESQLLLISTLKNEFDLSMLSDTLLPVCIDIQWFLRWCNGEKKRFDSKILQTRWEVYIKATREEFSYIDNHNDTWFTFIITDGWSDIGVLQKNKTYRIPIQSGDFKDTIGAGDTFFAIFCAKLLETNDIEQVVQQASIFTYWFLRDKNNISLLN